MPRLKFGEFELDCELARLERDGRDVHLQPKVFRLLEYLIQERHRVVSQEQLLGAIWASEHVVPGVLPSAIRSLRRALDDDADTPRYIRTVQGRGYHFVAQVAEPEAEVSNDASHWPIVVARHALFVGREPELGECHDGIANSESSVQLVFVHGVPGIGKTSLLHELAYQCEGRGLAVVRLDAQYLGPSPDTFLEALRAASGDEGFPTRSGSLRLFLMDNYEQISALDDWIREILLPRLAASNRLVLATRNRPRTRWRSDPGWQRVVREIELGPLGKEDSARLLLARNQSIVSDEVEACWSLTKGYPLALALSAESPAGATNVGRVERNAELIEALVERFTEAISEPRQRQALEVASLFEEVDERTLRVMLEPAKGDGLFDWLGVQPFVRRVRGGVAVHVLAREALIADLLNRDPNRLQELAGRGIGLVGSELARVSDRTTGLRLSRNLMGLSRHHPMVRPFYREDGLDQLELRRAVGAAYRELPALVERHEGPRAAEIAQRWLERQPEEVWIVRDEADRSAGFVQLLLLTAADRDAANWDPVVAAIFAHVDSLGGWSGGDVSMVHRYIVGAERYQAVSPVMQRCFEVVTYYENWFSRGPSPIAHAYDVLEESAIWAAVEAFKDYALVEDHFATVGRRASRLFHHSYRDCPADQRDARIARHLMSGTVAPPADAGPPL